MPDTLIVAIGSSVMTDDAIGHHIIKQLEQLNVNAEVVDLGMDLFRLRLLFHNQKRIIIVDAMKGNYPPGTILEYKYQKNQDLLEAKIRDIHHIGSIEALDIMCLADIDLAKIDIYFVGVIIETIEKGLELSPEIKNAIPNAVEKIISLII
ncbi:MAG: hydrogenase maturation protease [Candidatus Thorarchaeota archaeon]